MSTSVRIVRRGYGLRMICFGTALILAGGASVTALLAMTFVATDNLAVAISHRPNISDGWLQAAPTRQAPARINIASAVIHRPDRLNEAFRSVEAAGHGDEALGARLVAAYSSAHDARPQAFEAQVAKLLDEPRVISPDAPVQLASLTPPIQSIWAETVDAAPVPHASADVDRAPAPLARVIAEPARAVPLPLPRPAILARTAPAPVSAPIVQASLESAPRPALAYATPELEPKSDGPNDFFRKLLNQDDSLKLPRRASGIAVYDIASATVRLPNGEKLEAHSGLGHRQDDPRFVREKNRGPTPPNVYNLVMREALFHGAAAIRLLPRDQKKVFNRDGLLAHPYMYVGGGDRSQSNGCVVFKDYGRFLRAFRAGEIARLVVVPSMDELPTYMAGL